MVEIFKTNVQEENDAHHIVVKLLEHFPSYEVSFDLEDCDKILRIEGNTIDSLMVCNLLQQLNYACSAIQ